MPLAGHTNHIASITMLLYQVYQVLCLKGATTCLGFSHYATVRNEYRQRNIGKISGYVDKVTESTEN